VCEADSKPIELMDNLWGRNFHLVSFGGANAAFTTVPRRKLINLACESGQYTLSKGRI
jgi:hypothetical protein